MSMANSAAPGKSGVAGGYRVDWRKWMLVPRPTRLRARRWKHWRRGTPALCATVKSVSTYNAVLDYSSDWESGQGQLVLPLLMLPGVLGVNWTFLLDCPDLGLCQTWRRHAWNGKPQPRSDNNASTCQ